MSQLYDRHDIDPAEPKRPRIGSILKHGVFPCTTCRKPHNYRLIENSRFPLSRLYSWADPKDGHAYAHGEQNTYEVLSEALARANRRLRRAGLEVVIP